MPDPIKILLTSPYDLSTPGGVNNQMITLLNFLRDQTDFEVGILAPDSAQLDVSAHTVYRAPVSHTVSANGSKAHLALGRGVKQTVHKALEAFNPDLVHLQEPLVPGISLGVLKHSRANTHVGTFHTSGKTPLLYQLARPWLRHAINRLDRRIAVSPAARTYIDKAFPGSYEIIPNVIDTGSKKAPTPRAEHAPPFHILFVGRLSEPRKGFSYFLDAAQHLEQSTPGTYRFTVVGSGDEAWQSRAKNMPIKFMGHLKDKELIQTYASADLLCAPSTRGESFGVILLEAFQSGIPVVTFDIPGYRDVVISGRNGQMAVPGDTCQLASCIRESVEDKNTYTSLCHGARETALNYDVNRHFPRLLSIYRELLQNPSDGSPMSAPTR